MDKILINDLLNIPDSDIGNTRLKLNVFNRNTDPLEEYKRDPRQNKYLMVLMAQPKKVFSYRTNCHLLALSL